MQIRRQSGHARNLQLLLRTFSNELIVRFVQKRELLYCWWWYWYSL
jgi:hypothetical protein